MRLNWNYMLHNLAKKNSYHLYNAKTDESIIIKRSRNAYDICRTCDITIIHCTDLMDIREYKQELRQKYLEYEQDLIKKTKGE